MACPRCLFENPPEARWCGYCGADLHAAVPDPGEASKARKPRIGPPADEDPFRAAASLRGGTAARTIAPRPPPPPAAIPSVVPSPEPASVEAPSSRRRTLVEDEAPPTMGEIAGTLLILAEGAPARAVVLREGRLRIGRSPGNDIVVDDPRVSGDHAILRVEGGRAFWLDTSTNGSTVAGRKVVADRADLRDGTVVEVGRTALVLHLLGDETLAALRGLGA